MEAPEIDHRHVSHLYALYPGLAIDPIETPDLAQAARRSLDIRGDEATGWGNRLADLPLGASRRR